MLPFIPAVRCRQSVGCHSENQFLRRLNPKAAAVGLRILKAVCESRQGRRSGCFASVSVHVALLSLCETACPTRACVCTCLRSTALFVRTNGGAYNLAAIVCPAEQVARAVTQWPAQRRQAPCASEQQGRQGEASVRAAKRGLIMARPMPGKHRICTSWRSVGVRPAW